MAKYVVEFFPSIYIPFDSTAAIKEFCAKNMRDGIVWTEDGHLINESAIAFTMKSAIREVTIE